jgi:integrase
MGNRTAEIIEMYLAYILLRGMAKTTLKRRRSSLRAFARYLHPLCITNADRGHVEDWLTLFGEASTRKAYRSDLSDFFQWGVRRDVMSRNPVAQTDGIRVPKSLPRPVPPAIVPGIIAAAPTEKLRLALMLAAYAGLRRAEICALTGHDIQLHPNALIVVRNGKGSKDRIVPMHPLLAAELADVRGGGRLVPWTPDHLGTVAAEHIRACGYDATIHKLRASYATEAARVLDGNIVAVGKLLGHESPATTMQYVGWGGGDTSQRLAGIYAA